VGGIKAEQQPGAVRFSTSTLPRPLVGPGEPMPAFVVTFQLIQGQDQHQGVERTGLRGVVSGHGTLAGLFRCPVGRANRVFEARRIDDFSKAMHGCVRRRETMHHVVSSAELL
jgi:hypothetical protein